MFFFQSLSFIAIIYTINSYQVNQLKNEINLELSHIRWDITTWLKKNGTVRLNTERLVSLSIWEPTNALNTIQDKYKMLYFFSIVNQNDLNTKYIPHTLYVGLIILLWVQSVRELRSSRPGFRDTQFSKFDRSNGKLLQLTLTFFQCSINCIVVKKIIICLNARHIRPNKSVCFSLVWWPKGTRRIK